MADIEDDYVIVGASSDNFDCDDTGGWTEGGNGSAVTTQDNKVEGSKALGLQTSDKDESWWYHDVSSGNRFKITSKDLGLWFYYIKGKGDNFLVQNSTAVVMRLYFGGTSKYADYRLTEAGDLSLAFGWQMLMCSGKEMNGGSTGGGHNNGTDWDLDIYRLEFRLNAAVKIDVSLGLDAIFIGSQITVNGGTSSSPITVEDIANYTFNTRSDFPIGTVEMTGKLANIKSGLKIDSAGYVSANNIYLLFNQLSNDVKHNVDVYNGTFLIGNLNNSKAMNGCQIVKPDGFTANFTVSSSGTLKVYNSKFYRWNEVSLGGICDIVYTDFDSNEVLKLNSSNNKLQEITVHDSTHASYDEGVLVQNDVQEVKDILVYRCKDGVKFSADCTFSELKLLDNTEDDIVIVDTKVATIIDSSYTTIRRV